MPRIWIAVLGLLFALGAITPGALAQSNSYKQANLTSDAAGVAANVEQKNGASGGCKDSRLRDSRRVLDESKRAKHGNARPNTLELRKKAGAATGAGILQSGLLTSPRSAKFQRFSAAFVMLPTETEGAVMVTVESQAGEVLFIGQPGYPVATLNELAREADAARRER